MTLIRVFVSIHVPNTEPMDALRRDLKIAGARASPLEQTHITLRFIGDVDDSKVKRIEDAVRASVAGIGPFHARISGIGAFPNEKRPSVVWVGAEPADILGTIADNLGRELSARRIDYDSKPFKAHVTLARCRDGLGSRRVFEDYAGTAFSEFDCTEVLIMKSVLGPSGAKHTVLAKIPLEGPGQHI
ncbi:MAG: RNA 2',3'-cyclic phosphodiesterase [Thermoplasmata archaeon]|nr:RNA 2',3'-cyclic phosphodiesterase [Thermoplasmata archaeon]